jgi:hypothetical protein
MLIASVQVWLTSQSAPLQVATALAATHPTHSIL